MPTDAPLQKIADLLHSRLSLRLVYGEPVREGERTVIPVARVAFGFGAGGGGGHRPAEPGEGDGEAEGYGSGGGGGARIAPVGALEIGPEGTRFVRFRPLAPLLGAAGVGLALGWVLGRRL